MLNSAGGNTVTLLFRAGRDDAATVKMSIEKH